MPIKGYMHNQGAVWWRTVLLEEHTMPQFLQLQIDKFFQHIQVIPGCSVALTKKKGQIK
jgi:hypothetical protein